MQNVSRCFERAAVLSATLAVVALPGLAGAQSGSAGGSVGNDEKSLSGSRETPRAIETSRPARRSKPEEPRRASRKSGGSGNGGGNLDGAWVLTSVGSPCGTSSDTVVITGSRMVGQYGTAQVSPNGSVSGIGSAGSLTWSMPAVSPAAAAPVRFGDPMDASEAGPDQNSNCEWIGPGEAGSS